LTIIESDSIIGRSGVTVV